MSIFRCAPMQPMCLVCDVALRRACPGYSVHGGFFADLSSSFDVLVVDRRSVCGTLRKPMIRVEFVCVNLRLRDVEHDSMFAAQLLFACRK
jgi:hypothetical protein